MRLVHFPESPDPRFTVYLDAPEEGCVFTLEAGALKLYPRFTDDTLDEPAEVDFSPGGGLEDEAVSHLRAIEALLRDVKDRLAEIDRLYAEWKRRPV